LFKLNNKSSLNLSRVYIISNICTRDTQKCVIVSIVFNGGVNFLSGAVPAVITTSFVRATCASRRVHFVLAQSAFRTFSSLTRSAKFLLCHLLILICASVLCASKRILKYLFIIKTKQNSVIFLHKLNLKN
jgi:hypothetical protein